MEGPSIPDSRRAVGLGYIASQGGSRGLQEELLVESRKAGQRMRFRLLRNLNHLPKKLEQVTQCVGREGVIHAVVNILSQGTAGATVWR